MPATAVRTRLVEVASFEHQVTGVTVSEDGRIFVNFPRWTEDIAVSVAELAAGRLAASVSGRRVERVAQREDGTRSRRRITGCACRASSATGAATSGCSIPPRPRRSRSIPNGPKLVQIDLATDTVVRVLGFDETVAPQGTYLNDVRFSLTGRYAYITDSGPKGALVVVDLNDGSAWRVLEGHPSTQPEKDVVVHTDGKPLRRPDGRGAMFAADGIALSRDGDWLYWQALTGKTLYRVPTAVAARRRRVGRRGRCQAVEASARTASPTDSGSTPRDRMYISALEENAVKRREGDRVETLVQDERLRWPDTFSEGPDGTIYVTASHIQDMPWYVPQNPIEVRTSLFRLEASD